MEENDKLRERLINYASTMIHDYSNEIPEELLDGSKLENHVYKVRTNWFQGVIGVIDLAYARGLLPKEFNQEVEQFFETFRQRRRNSVPARTTKEEIDTGDDFLRRTIEHLKK